MKDGEEVDLSSACIEETEALVSYTQNQIAWYKNKNPSEVPDKKSRYFTP